MAIKMEIKTGNKSTPGGGSKTKLLDAAVGVVRAKGYSATTVDDICGAAEVTKGAFFHHFKSKEDLAIAAAEHWGAVTTAAFASAPYQSLSDPLDRVLAYVDFRKVILQGALSEYTCFVGTMIQEVYDTHPAIREACEKTISDHTADIEADIAEAMRKYKIEGEWTAKSLALYTQAVIQGAFILAKAKQGAQVASDCIDHLRRYIELLFPKSQTAAKQIIRA
jgi:TetR/AcrR family transcriptional repressor of nem operon